MNTTITVSTDLNVRVCPSCSGVYAITNAYFNEAKRIGGFKKPWTCPYCKEERGFGEGENDKLKKQIEELASNAEYFRKGRDAALQEADHFRKSRDGMKGALCKERKRIVNGACPCCNRTFANLASHMKSKHPTHADL